MIADVASDSMPPWTAAAESCPQPTTSFCCAAHDLTPPFSLATTDRPCSPATLVLLTKAPPPLLPPPSRHGSLQQHLAQDPLVRPPPPLLFLPLPHSTANARPRTQSNRLQLPIRMSLARRSRTDRNPATTGRAHEPLPSGRGVHEVDTNARDPRSRARPNRSNTVLAPNNPTTNSVTNINSMGGMRSLRSLEDDARLCDDAHRLGGNGGLSLRLLCG